MIHMKQVEGRRAEQLVRMRRAEQTDCCVIDEERAEVPADQYPVGKRLHEIAKQLVMFVEDGPSLGISWRSLLHACADRPVADTSLCSQPERDFGDS